MSGGAIKDYYYILGIPHNAANDEIITAYNKLSQKFHPDQNEGDNFFEERFKDIQEAYETLSDKARKKIYDQRLNVSRVSSSFQKTAPGHSQNTQQTSEPLSPITPIRRKNKLRQTLYGLIALVVFSSPAWLQPLIHKLNEEERPANSKKEKEEISDPLKKDTSDVKLLRIIYDSSETSTTDIPTGTGKEVTDPAMDDEGLTAQNVIDRFFAALSNRNCPTAWELTYVSSWVNRGEDWFCSFKAFGTTTGLMVYETKPIEQNDNNVNFYAEYYTEDSYNGNKCYKQTIRVEKLHHTDNKWRWKITRMENNLPPVVCDGF